MRSFCAKGQQANKRSGSCSVFNKISARVSEPALGTNRGSNDSIGSCGDDCSGDEDDEHSSCVPLAAQVALELHNMMGLFSAVV